MVSGLVYVTLPTNYYIKPVVCDVDYNIRR